MTEETTNLPLCPKCESPMVLRHGRMGDFYGCPKYPDCRGTRDIEGEKESFVKKKPLATNSGELDELFLRMAAVERNLHILKSAVNSNALRIGDIERRLDYHPETCTPEEVSTVEPLLDDVDSDF